MKVLMILIVVGIIALVLVFQFGGYAGLDPEAQAAEFTETVERGMTWEEVTDLREPREFVPVNPANRTGEGQPRSFSRSSLSDITSDDEEMRHGFKFKYRFDASNHYNVVFDTRGEVQEIYEPATMDDLLQGQPFGSN